ncbi:MAG: hypothetical protein JKY34_07730 [Kordiimonadaceae bacterium]|nr:hypothetical protein [Kordiimonadaceae bacterium]
MKLTLKRFHDSGSAVRGLFFINGAQTCFTVERPWVDNAVGISCIPEGSYLIKPKTYGKFGTLENPALWLQDVPGRTHILIHGANRAEQLQGCIAPGVSCGPDYVGRSRDALKLIKRAVFNAWNTPEEVTIDVTHITR